jgi:hypothetical protein
LLKLWAWKREKGWENTGSISDDEEEEEAEEEEVEVTF